MPKIIIIGETSYLAQGLQRAFPNDEVHTLFRPDLNKNASFFQSADVIINFCIHPDFYNRDFSVNEIIDTDIAKCIQGTKTRYFFLSSRKVYGKSKDICIYSEEDPLIGTDFYSRNKIKEEKHLLSLLGDQLTIVRISNVIGAPILRKNYQTFIGWITSQMAKNHFLSVTENPKVIKDFITRSYLHKAFYALIHNDARGIYNIGSGFGVSIFELLTEMVGEENVHFQTQKPPEDQFILNCRKLHCYLPSMPKKMLLDQCHKNQFSLHFPYLGQELTYT